MTISQTDKESVVYRVHTTFAKTKGYAKHCKKDGIRPSPVVDIAFPLVAPLTDKNFVFCGTQLPDHELELPVILNANFGIGSNRRAISWETGNRTDRCEWNAFLLDRDGPFVLGYQHIIQQMAGENAARARELLPGECAASKKEVRVGKKILRIV